MWYAIHFPVYIYVHFNYSWHTSIHDHWSSLFVYNMNVPMATCFIKSTMILESRGKLVYNSKSSQVKTMKKCPSFRIITSFREVSYQEKKRKQKKKIFWDAMRLCFFGWRTVYPIYLVLSTSDVVGGPSKISLKTGAMTFRDACALRCL